MNIKRMTATFGRLSGQTLTLAPGFNLIEAPNEGGKSTWAAFLKAMLYGIDTRDRDKKGYLADKNRYQPWSGAPMEGELVLEWQGRDITIRRSPRGNTPFGAFSAVYTGTEEPVPGLTAASCGELLTGVGREVFERSAFLGQSGSLAITAAPELERRIAALVSSGEEDVSYSQAEGRLKEWLNRRRVNKSVGRIPQLEGELSQVRASREELEQLTGALNALAAEERGLRRRKEALEEELAAHRQLAQLQLDRRYPGGGGARPGPGGPGRPAEGAVPVRLHPPQGGAEAGPGGAGLSEGPGTGDQKRGGGPGPGGGGTGPGPGRRPGRPLSRTDGGAGGGGRQTGGGRLRRP